MKNWKISPSNSLLAKYIDCYWFIEKSLEDICVNQPKLNPDPAAHLILAPKDQVYRYQFKDTDISGSGCHIILPNTATIKLDHSEPFVILGIKFHVGALYSLKFGSAFPLSNSVVVDSNFLPPELHCVGNPQFFSEVLNQPELTCARLDKELLPWVSKNHEDRHSQLVRKAITIIERTPISKISDELSCSKRTIERAFRRVTGLTLKQYQSMIMLEALLAYLYKNQEKSLSWADVSARFGFSDQSHLIRYLKKTIGATPSDYLKQRDITIDVYGDFE